ncbi:MAG: hypothetical protein KAG66_22295, partial [Methylococcales bacterium]|nr:hypothetical protein [Methylococcales bacterium]
MSFVGNSGTLFIAGAQIRKKRPLLLQIVQGIIMAQMTDSKQPQTQPTHAWHTLNWIWSAVFFGVLLIS